MTVEERVIEFLSCISSLEIAAWLDRAKADARVRDTCLRMRKRITDPVLRATLQNIARATQPLATRYPLKAAAVQAAGGEIHLVNYDRK